MTDFSGKTVLITGATSGIGRATASLFLDHGAVVGVNHLNSPQDFQSLQRQHAQWSERLIELPADVSDSQAVNQMVDTLVAKTGRVDVLVNNAGISLIKPLLETSDADFDRIINTDLKSVFYCCRAALPYLMKTQGAVVNVASELALSGRAKLSAYTAAKGGIISFSRSIAREFAPNVRVNVVAPGPTQTPLLEAESKVVGHQESVDDIPLQRFASAEEIAESILFMASAKASYFTGAVISPNGGTVIG